MKPMLAQVYDGRDVTGYYMSEKFDGVRAIWDGSMLTSREGNAFFAPKSFTDQLPRGFVFDGELWMGRGRYKEILSITMSKDADWSEVKFMCFDLIPIITNFNATVRLHTIDETQKSGSAFRIPRQSRCKGSCDLRECFESIKRMGGEGIMLRNPNGEYQQRRSWNLMKVKSLKHLLVA